MSHSPVVLTICLEVSSTAQHTTYLGRYFRVEVRSIRGLGGKSGSYVIADIPYHSSLHNGPGNILGGRNVSQSVRVGVRA